jgi:hypothetical protein
MNHRKFLPIKEQTERVPSLVKTKFLYLSSKYRDSGNINGFSVNLPSGFFKKIENQQIKISLNNITLTKSWYETQAGVSADYQNSSGSHSIPDGSYSVENLYDVISADSNFSTDYTVSYNYATNKFSFIAKNALTSFFKPINCGYLFGLYDGVTYNGSFTSVFPCNMTFYKTLYVNTNISTSGNSLDNIMQSRVDYSTIIGIIPISVAPFDVLQYSSTELPNSGLLVDGNSIDTMRVWISTDKNVALTLYEDYQVSFKIEYYIIN